MRAGFRSLLLISLAGCAGEGIVDPIAPAMCTDEFPFRAELHCIQQFVFTPTCARAGCHASPGPQAGMDLSDGVAHMNTVGVVSAEQPPLLRIEAGDPNDSYLVRKIQGDPSISLDRMPLGGPFLTQDEIDVIREWILDGALDN